MINITMIAAREIKTFQFNFQSRSGFSANCFVNLGLYFLILRIIIIIIIVPIIATINLIHLNF